MIPSGPVVILGATGRHSGAWSVPRGQDALLGAETRGRLFGLSHLARNLLGARERLDEG
jgi:hypothetical protein